MGLQKGPHPVGMARSQLAHPDVSPYVTRATAMVAPI